MNLEEFCDELEGYLQEKGYDDLNIDVDTNVVNIYLDNPNVDNYNEINEIIELFFADSNKYYIEDFDIDGDYEGYIELSFLD